MSFTSDIKKELSDLGSIEPKLHQTLLYGMLFCLKSSLRFSTETKEAVILLKKLLNKHFPSVSFIEKSGRFKVLEIDELSIPILTNHFSLEDTKINREILIGNDEYSSAFLRGVFLVCGWVSSPEKKYHLEITLPNSKKAENIFSLINEHGLTVKKSIRNNCVVIYQKESEAIEDFLTFIGASGFSMEIMSAKIYKDFRNKVNRTVNCENANLDKTLTASGKQIDAIKLIFETRGESYLEPQLREVARLRLENIEMSLRELGELVSPPISRSGVNHRLKKICEIAENLK